jgi:excisionase family DNA binding protein
MKDDEAKRSEERRTKHPHGLLDGAEVAAVLSTTPRHIRRLVEERRIPFVKVGRFVRFVSEDIEAWVASHRINPIDDSYSSGW